MGTQLRREPFVHDVDDIIGSCGIIGRNRNKVRCALTFMSLLLIRISPVYSSQQQQQQQRPDSIFRAVTADIYQSSTVSNRVKLSWKPTLSTGLFRTISAFSHRKRKRVSESVSNFDDEHNRSFYKLIEDKATSIQEVAVKTIQRGKRKISSHNSYEFLLGITPQTIQSISKSTQKASRPPPRSSINLQEGMSEALEELRSLRKQMEYMQKEISTLKQLQLGIAIEPETDQENIKENNKKRIREYERIAKDVERWAESILFPSSSTTKEALDTGGIPHNLEEDWVEIPCHKMFKQKWNRNGMTRAYLKYMKDSRSQSSITTTTTTAASKTTKSMKAKVVDSDSDTEWPCVRLYSIIDAPCSEVCTYLSQERHASEYNQLMDKYQDLDIISPHSKICYASSPQLLFIKPRDLITFCSHRWKRDGTQVVINQACDQYGDRVATAFALRGATYISPDPNDPDHKTHIAMLAHASPGNDLPKWACRTAIQSLLPIEPYRLFYKINEGIKQCRTELQETYRRQQEDVASDTDDDSDNNSNKTEMVGNNSGGRSSNRNVSRAPAGLAQLGYGCFWPNGGGTIEAGDGRPSAIAIRSPVDEEIKAESLEEKSDIEFDKSTQKDEIGEFQ